jgi:hypothetical protein
MYRVTINVQWCKLVYRDLSTLCTGSQVNLFYCSARADDCIGFHFHTNWCWGFHPSILMDRVPSEQMYTTSSKLQKSSGSIQADVKGPPNWCTEHLLNSSQILSPWLGVIVVSRKGLSYRPAGLCSLAGRYDNSAKVNVSPQSGTMNLTTGLSNDGRKSSQIL